MIKYRLLAQIILCHFPIFSPGSRLVAASKAGMPTVGEPAVALQLSNSSKTAANALNELQVAADKAAEACGSLEIDNALAAVKELEGQVKGHS